MTKAISKVEQKSQEKFLAETRNLKLKETMKGSKLAIWKEQAIQIQEAFDVHVKMHKVEQNQWATLITLLEEKAPKKTHQLEEHG